MSTKGMVLEIIELAYDINTTTTNHVFVDYAPHVDMLSIRIFEDGWANDKEPIILKIDIFENVDSRFAEYKTLIEGARILKEVLKNG